MGKTRLTERLLLRFFAAALAYNSLWVNDSRDASREASAVGLSTGTG